MIYFDRRVYTQCALITKIFIADRLETPIAFDNGQVFIKGMIISNMISRFISLARSISPDKNSPYKFNDLFQLLVLNLAGNIRNIVAMKFDMGETLSYLI